jgi:hypothetical protein
MSHLRRFVESAGSVANIQGSILDAMEQVFTQEEYLQLEATLLAPGYEGWESRAIQIVKMGVQDRWDELRAHAAEITARYKAAVPYPGQSKEFWVDPVNRPHLRVYWCLKCGHQQTSMALSGICCHGQPACLRCKHEVHEANCRRKKSKKKSPEQEPK